MISKMMIVSGVIVMKYVFIVVAVQFLLVLGVILFALYVINRQKKDLLGVFNTDLTDYEKTFVIQSRLIKQGHQHCFRCFRVAGIQYTDGKGNKQKIQLLNHSKDKKVCSDCKKEFDKVESKIKVVSQ